MAFSSFGLLYPLLITRNSYCFATKISPYIG